MTTTFSKRGLVVSVGGSYGPLVTGVIKDADGLTQKLVYGDLAKTETVFTYDQRRRVRTVQTYRGPPSCWKVGQLDDPPPECKGYAAGELYGSSEPTTFPLLLEDTEFTYDHVDNPIELRDWRLPHEWPAGAKPVSKKAEYDDLYRLKRLEYVYAAGKDGWTSPFAHEDAKATQGGEVGIGEKPPADVLPRQSFDDRLLWQTYRYDWLGNSVSSDDDAHGFYDRSLGAIKNGTATAGPYQLKEASNETAGKKPREGRLSAKYDEAGYLTDLAVNRSATGLCLPANKPCNHRFRYDWDEVGRLAMARRWDASTAVTVNDALPTEVAAVTLRHTYDGGDMRTVKEATSCASGAVSGLCAPFTTHSVYVFDSLDLRRAYFSGLSGEEPDYEATAETEAAYLVANGVRLARLHHAPTLPVVDGDGLHVLLELADHLGSGAIVLDKATSELAERMTYQGYGAVESDYRPGRWGAFREDYRFTGKEEDSEVGLTYFGFRYLNTALGRWASADPLTVHGVGADLNEYAYVHGRVLSATDPVGLDSDFYVTKDGEKHSDQSLDVDGKYEDRWLRSDTIDEGGPSVDQLSQMDTYIRSARLPLYQPHREETIGEEPTKPDPRSFGGISYYVTKEATGSETAANVAGATGAVVDLLISGAPSGRGPARKSARGKSTKQQRGPGYCTGGKCACFAAGTLVWTPIGSVPIESIIVGDLVLSRDEVSGEFSWQPVEQVFVTEDREILELTLLWSGGGETFGITAEHPLWVDGEGWVEAGYLREGDRIARADQGEWATVQSLRGPPVRTNVHNFVVKNTHSYFVGLGTVWAHNGGPCGGWGLNPRSGMQGFEDISEFSSQPISTRQRKMVDDSLSLPYGTPMVTKFRNTRQSLRDNIAMTRFTALEFAFFVNRSNGKQIIMSGWTETVPIEIGTMIGLREDGYEWLSHVHPNGFLMPSSGDIFTMQMMGQKTTWIGSPNGLVAKVEFGHSPIKIFGIGW